MIRVLCYGDSNTHGTAPMATPDDVKRFGPDERWPGVTQAALGVDFDIVEEGLPGRTTVHDDPFEGAHKNGRSYLLPCLESHWPLDVVVIMLGVNDLKSRFGLSATDIAFGAVSLLPIVKMALNQQGQSPKILLVAAPPIQTVGWLGAMFEGGAETSRQLASVMGVQAERNGVAFFDAGTIATVSPIDGIHFDAAAHRAIGLAIADRIRALTA